MNRSLDVYLYNHLAGNLIQQHDGSLSFSYDDGYLSSARAHPISISMPLSPSVFPDRIAKPYFSGLLPDENARRKLASFLGISEGNPFALLGAIGGECAGALAIYPSGVEPVSFQDSELDVLDDDRLINIISLLHERPLMAGEEGVRLSLAGVQDKLAVCISDGKIALAKNGAPTTHILKPIMNELENTVENELFCMTLAKRMKLDAPHVEIRYVHETPYYLIERYDRKVGKDGRIERIHQEDFCQALSIPPEFKYEEEGGPGVKACLDLLQNHSARPALDRLNFIRMLIFNYLVGNADAHGKNYSLIYKGNTPVLAPVYDILCTAAYSRLSKKLAMKIGERDIPDTIHLQHWYSLVADAKSSQRALAKELKDMAENIVTESNQLLSEFKDNGMQNSVLNTLSDIIKKRKAHILRF